jgi:hypothetical protein
MGDRFVNAGLLQPVDILQPIEAHRGTPAQDIRGFGPFISRKPFR